MYAVGSRVVTRRGKTGTVVGHEGDDILVKFGSYDPIRLRPTQVVTESAYERMQAGARTLASNQRYNAR